MVKRSVDGFDIAAKEVGRKMHDRPEQPHGDRLPGQPPMEGDEHINVGWAQRAKQDRAAVAQQPGPLSTIARAVVTRTSARGSALVAGCAR